MTITRKTSHSFNSPAVVKHQIRSAEKTHWLWGLRQAEIIVEERSEALQYNREELQLLKAQEFAADCKIAAARINRTMIRIQKMAIDAIGELEAAQDEHDRICAANPIVLELTSSEIEELYSGEVWETRQIGILTEKMVALNFGPEMASALMDIPMEKRRSFMDRAAQQMGQIVATTQPKLSGESNDN